MLHDYHDVLYVLNFVYEIKIGLYTNVDYILLYRNADSDVIHIAISAGSCNMTHRSDRLARQSWPTVPFYYGETARAKTSRRLTSEQSDGDSNHCSSLSASRRSEDGGGDHALGVTNAQVKVTGKAWLDSSAGVTVRQFASLPA